MEQIYRDEVIPGFATRYVASTIERFENPFLYHPLRDIAQNHVLKIERRIAAFAEWVHARTPAAAQPQLMAIAEARRT